MVEGGGRRVEKGFSVEGGLIGNNIGYTYLLYLALMGKCCVISGGYGESMVFEGIYIT